MKNTSNALRRVMSVVLVFAMMFTSMPTGALAEDVVDPAPSTTAAEPAASETTEPTTPEPASSEAAPAANSAVLPANDGDPAPVTFTVTFVANGETLVTQTIQQGGSAVAPDAPLVSGQRFVRWDTDFTNVQSDLTVTAVYEAITAKNMTVEYRYSDGTQAAPSHVEQAVVGEPFHKTVPSPALDGFTPDKAEVVFAVESVTEDLTVVVTYSGAARNYTVKHLFQNVEGTAYAEDEALRETLEGTTGLDTAAQAKTVEGFTALPITQVKVASSGETVVEVKYDRNSYLLTWNTDGGSYIEPQMLKYGAAVSAPADPTKVGYTFAGWDLVPETMPAAATTVTAQWANATQASYQVVYWGENLTGGYDYLYADKATGAVGGNIPYSTSLTASHMPQGLEAAGFELDSAKSAGNVEITADGSAVKNVYFSRKTFTISFYRQSWVGWPDFEYKWVEDTSLRITAKYGEDVSARWEAACEDDGWGPNKNDNIQYTLIANMPAENLTMYEKSSGTGKKIEYRVQKVSGTGYDVYATFNASRGVSLTVEDQMPITGFTYDSWKKSGDSPLWLYYTRNSYNLVFENCTGVSNASLKFEARLSSAKPADSSVGRPAGMDSDYVFMGWYLDEAFQTPVDWSSTMPARNLQVYAKWAKPDYTVSFNTHGADTETPAPIGVAKYDTIEDQMPADPTREGYVFAGWYTDEAYTVPFVATQQIVRNLTLHAKWTRTDSCTYVIVAKDTEGNELKRVDGSEVEVGASVTVNAPVIDGYQAQQSSQNVKILDDGQEVVFVYDKLQNWTATVHHYIEGTTEKVAEDVIRSDLTVNSLLVYSATVSGYELAEGTSYVQTATRENSEITFYYKKIADSAYTVNHYYGSNASLTETVTGTAKAGSLVTADVINKAGYTCVTSGAALSAYVAKDGSTVINVYYAANDQTYSVYYYLEGTETPVPGTTAKENVSAKFDETVTETALAVTGYTVAGDSTRSITVGADNAANKIVFYYTVNSYPLNITYKYADDVPDAALRGQKAAEPVSRDIAFGAPYSVASPLIPGYTASVAAVAGTMAENGVTVEVVYRAATDTAYTVKHMLQDVTGDGYTEDAAARQTLHGTTGADTNAAAKSYEGFTAQAVVQQAIAADGSTVVEIKYDRNSYEVTYAYVGTAPAGASALPEKATVKYGAPVAVAAAATAPGYTFSGWSQKEDFTMPAENVTITGSFTANSNTEYTVRHHFQNILDDAYDADTAMLSETLSGTTDTLTAAAAKTVAGFTAQSFQQKNIAGDGSTVVDIYYNRNSYGVSYRYLNTPAGASALPAGASYRFGAAVTVAEAATAPGYTFSGWSTGDFTMPAQDVEITGSFTANGDTAYTVEHYQQNLAGDGYDLVEADTEHLTGETDTTATANPKAYTGFTFDGTVEGTVASGNIAGDGSLVLKLYYTRNSYEVSYAYTGTVPAGASALPAAASYKYGADVTVAPQATAPGYTFNGWLEDGKVTASFKMPAGPVQLTGSFTANTDTRYTVEHWTEDLDGEGYTLRETEANLTGVTDTTATAEAKSYEGFRFDEDNENNVLTGVITGDGKLVLKVYYARNSYEVSYDYGAAPTGASQLPGTVSYKYGAEVRVADKATAPGYTFDGWKKDNAEVTSFTMPAGAVQLTGRFTANTDTGYKVEHYQQNLAGDAFVLFETEEQNATTDTHVSATPKDYTGFTYDGTVDGTVTEGNVAGDGSLVLKLYYTRDSYKVTYQYTGKVPTGASELPAETTEKYGAAVTVAADATAPGYTFSGWSREDGFTMPAENVTITGSFTANGETPYKVEHYQQNLEDDGYTLAETENLTGETDTTATANPKTYTGFAFDGTAEGTVASGNIAGDGSLVLKLYYTRNSYDVAYAYTGTVPTGASALPEKATVKYGAPVTVAEAATAPGYTFSGWSRNDFTMPAENVTITGSFTANSNTEYTVRHHFQNILDDAYDADTAMLSETLSGTTDTLTAAAAAKTVAGFTAQSFQQKNIAGDGSTVVDIYYNRNSYTVTYAVTGTVDPNPNYKQADYRFGQNVAAEAAAAKAGYDFIGWANEPAVMPANDVTATGYFVARTDTAYQVQHYKQNLEDDGFTLAETEELTGKTDTIATANPKTYTGFMLDRTVEGTVASGNIAGDGSLVLKLYYTRNSYGVTYAYTGTVPADASALPEKAAVKYGAPVTVAEAATAKGHTFSGWSTGDFTMPAQDVEITGSFTANPYNVTVEYYFDKAQDTDMTRVQSVTYGETFTTAAAAETDRNGVHYTLDWVENNGLTVSDIEADNVVRVYYAKDEEGGPDDIPDYAQIVFTYQSADVRKGTVDKSVEIHTFERLNGELLEEKKASPAGANAAGREGYAFDYWTDGTKRDVTSGMETLKSEVYTDNAEFTAYFDVDTKGIDPEDPDKPDNVPDKYQAKVTYQAVNGTVTLGDRTGTELVTYVTLFDADGKWAENGTGKLAEAQVPTAAAAADYDPATERWTPAVPAEGAEITADGAVFTVTWELAISGYQVHYYYDGVEDTASAVNATGKIGDAIPYDTGKTTFDGANYVLENVDGAGKLISKDAAANIVNVNFTKDEKSDPTKDPDPEVPGDNIPDKYQATVTFEAINGVLQPKGGTDAQNTKQMTTVVTLLNENGEPAENGTGYLTEAQIPTALANLGYIANTLFWGPATPTTSYAITGDITFVADFNAEGVIPEEPPVPPVTPVGPTAPEEGPEETIDEPETPLAPAEPEAPAEEPAEEEIEEADTPLASGAAWALLNLILMLCTALVSILLLIGFLGKKKKEDENENVEYTVKRKGVTRVLSLIPAIGSIIAFLLTENMRNPMVFVDRWTWLMVLIALVQVIVCIFARKEKEEPDDNAQTPAQA